MRKMAPLILASLVAACAPTPKPVAATAAPGSGAVALPTALTAPEAAADAGIATAKRELKALGYGSGKADSISDAAFPKAIQAFQKDQGMAEDGHLTGAVAERLRQVYAVLPKAAPAMRDGVFLFSDGSTRREAPGLLPPTPAGLVSDAPENFLLPLRPGSEASYDLGHRGKDASPDPVATVNCHVGRIAPATTALGQFDAMIVDCAGGPVQAHATYSLKLGMVVRQESGKSVREVVAIRPSTDDWPLAARTGLDWALTHALETGAPATWSSTAVAPHFEISAGAKLLGREAGLTGRYAALPCRRFEMAQSGGASYPGIACQTGAGTWSLPGSKTPLARPANGISTAPHTLQSAR